MASTTPFDPNKIDEDNLTPLLRACLENDFPRIKELVEKLQAEVNGRNSNNLTPLNLACNLGFVPIAQYLIDQGARLDIPTKAGVTPISSAISHAAFKQTEEGSQHYQAFIKEVLMLRQIILLGQRWSLGGEYQLNKNRFSLNDLSEEIVYDSLITSFKTYCELFKNDIMKILGQIEGITDEEKKQLINDIITSIEEGRLEDLSLVRKKLTSNDVIPILFTSKYEEGFHAENVIFYGSNRLLRMNRGLGSTGREGMELNLITEPENREKVIEHLLKGISQQRIEGEFVNEAIRKMLGLKKIGLVPMKEQRVGNCKWISAKAIVYGDIYAHLWTLLSQKKLEEEQIHKIILDVARTWYKRFTVYDRTRMLGHVINPYLEGDNPVDIFKLPRPLQEMFLQIYQRTQGKTKYHFVAKMLEKLGIQSFEEQLTQFKRLDRKDNKDKKDIKDSKDRKEEIKETKETKKETKFKPGG